MIEACTATGRFRDDGAAFEPTVETGAIAGVHR